MRADYHLKFTIYIFNSNGFDWKKLENVLPFWKNAFFGRTKFVVGKIKHVISNEFHSFIVHIKKIRLNDFVYVEKMSCCSKINTCIQTHWRSFNQKNMKKRIQNDVNYESGKKLWALLSSHLGNSINSTEEYYIHVLKKKRSGAHQMNRKATITAPEMRHTLHMNAALIGSWIVYEMINLKRTNNWIRAYVMGIYGVLVYHTNWMRSSTQHHRKMRTQTQ